MNFVDFEARADEIFEGIPPDYREGVDGLEVRRSTVPHPSLPGIYTLGECKSELYPSEFGGAGEVRSIVVLYYGSFLELSRTSEEWDWEGELWETITHEVRHHLESLATDDALEQMDYAEDQNFARREGESFDPFFYHSGHELAPGVYEVDGDLFFERTLDPRAIERRDPVGLEWEGEEIQVVQPAAAADVHFLRLHSPRWEEEAGERLLVLVRRRGMWSSLRRLLSGSVPEVLTTDVDAEVAR